MSNRNLSLKSCAVRGPAGKSAYQTAVAEGYTGTAEEYNALLAGVPGAIAAAPMRVKATNLVLEDADPGYNIVSADLSHTYAEIKAAVQADRPVSVDVDLGNNYHIIAPLMIYNANFVEFDSFFSYTMNIESGGGHTLHLMLYSDGRVSGYYEEV